MPQEFGGKWRTKVSQGEQSVLILGSQAVLVRVATDSLWTEGVTPKDQWIAQQHSNIIVIAILITSTLGSILTTVCGPILLSRDGRVSPKDDQPSHPPVTPNTSEFDHIKNTIDTIQYIDAI